MGVFAQKNEVTVTYMTTSQDSTTQAMFDMMGGFKIITMYKDNRIRTEANIMGTVAKSMIDYKKETGLMFMEIMGAMKAYILDKDYFKKEKEKKVPSNDVILTKDTKMIAGYKCNKALVSYENFNLVVLLYR